VVLMSEVPLCWRRSTRKAKEDSESTGFWAHGSKFMIYFGGLITLPPQVPLERRYPHLLPTAMPPNPRACIHCLVGDSPN